MPAGYELAPDYVDDPVDSDGDGFPDADDACPNEPGPGTVDGCPVVTRPTPTATASPIRPTPARTLQGPASNNGCPLTDTDGDGIPDADDDCPNQPGPASNDGCPVAEPDSDGDGIPDASDACPDEPGP